MSIDSIIRKAGTKIDIKYLSTTTGAGGKLVKTWVARYEDVPFRFEALRPEDEALFYDREKVTNRFAGRMKYKANISTRDRVYYGTREFDIKKIDNWDEQNLWLRIILEEITND